MWKFKAEQKVFQIGKYKIGGNPSDRPTWMIGSIFYDKHKIVKDMMKGEFDKQEAERLIKKQEELSDKTGNPHVIDVVAGSSQAIKRYLDFVTSVTDAPISIDGVSWSVRVAGANYVKEVGIKNPIIYNSLVVYEWKEEELNAIREAKIKAAILLLFYTKEFTVNGRIKALKEHLPILERAKIEVPLIDTCVIDIPSLGSACKTLYQIKDEFGFPVGCGAHNSVNTWINLKKKFGKFTEHPANATATAAAVVCGADFVLYGPIDHADYMFPIVAMINAASSQLAIEEGKMPSKTHPVFKIG